MCWLAPMNLERLTVLFPSHLPLTWNVFTQMVICSMTRPALGTLSTKSFNCVHVFLAIQPRRNFSPSLQPLVFSAPSSGQPTTALSGGFRVGDNISFPTSLVRQILRDQGYPETEPDYADRKCWSLIHGPINLRKSGCSHFGPLAATLQSLQGSGGVLVARTRFFGTPAARVPYECDAGCLAQAQEPLATAWEMLPGARKKL